MPRPPMRAVTTVCTSRALGTATAPTRNANLRTSPVIRYVTAAAVRATRRYSRTGRPAGVASDSGPTGSGHDHAEHLGDLVPGHRALAQHPGRVTGQVDDGRRRGVLGRAAVEVDGHGVAELCLGVLDRGGGGATR